MADNGDARTDTRHDIMVCLCAHMCVTCLRSLVCSVGGTNDNWRLEEEWRLGCGEADDCTPRRDWAQSNAYTSACWAANRMYVVGINSAGVWVTTYILSTLLIGRCLVRISAETRNIKFRIFHDFPVLSNSSFIYHPTFRCYQYIL
jgi:alpha/beta superfamily hydrolase